MGIDVYWLFDDFFFRDYDFNVIVNLDIGEIINIDFMVNDYLRISRILRRRFKNWI